MRSRRRAAAIATALLTLLAGLGVIAGASPAGADGPGYTGTLRVGSTVTVAAPYNYFAVEATLAQCQSIQLNQGGVYIYGSPLTPGADRALQYVRPMQLSSEFYIIGLGQCSQIAKGELAASVSISGTAKVGVALSASLSSSPSAQGVAYQWLRSATAGGVGSPIANATGSTYTPKPVDEGAYLSVQASLTAPNGYNDKTVTSAQTGPVATGTFTLPPATMGGLNKVGQVATAQLTSTAGLPAGWKAGHQWGTATSVGGTCTPIPGTASTDVGTSIVSYTARVADLGRFLCVRSGATAPGYQNATSTAYAAAAVAKGDLVAPTATITGGTTVGTQMSASFTSTPTPSTVTYQWNRASQAGQATTPIDGATGPTYTLTASDEAAFISVTATASGPTGYNDTTTESAQVGPIGKGTFSVPSATLGGQNKVDQTATAALASAAGLPAGWKVSHTWGTRTGSGNNATCSLIAGTTSSDAGTSTVSYTAAPADQGKTLCVTTTATAPGYLDATATSYAGGAVAKGDIIGLGLDLPASVVATHAITPDVTAPTTPAGAVLGYQWYVLDPAPGTGRTAIAGADAASFTPPADLREKTLQLEVIATDPNYVTETVTETIDVTPAAVQLPQIALTTTPQVGRPAIVKVTGTTVPSGADLAWQWYVNTVPVPGATTTSYTPTPADEGKSLTVSVTGTATYYDTTRALSNSRVIDATGAQDLTVTTTDDPTVGSPVRLTLTGGAATGSDLTYRWYVGNTYVTHNDQPSYTPAPTDAGKAISVRVTAVQQGRDPVTTAADLGTVKRATATGLAVRITGKAKVGKTLTGTLTGTPADARGGTTAYRWQADGKNIAHAVNPTLTLTKKLKGTTITLLITTTWVGYEPTTTTSTGVGPVKGRRQ